MAGLRQTSPRPLGVAALLAQVKRLQTQRHARDSQGIFFIEGIRNFIRAIDHDWPIAQIVYSEKLLTVPPARQRLRQARRSGVPTQSLTPEQFRQISTTERASGIGAIIQQPWSELKNIQPHSGLCWIVLEQVRSPGNFGSLIRTAEAVGAAGFILLGSSIDPFNPPVVRASMGSLFRQQFVRTQAHQLRRWITRHQLQVVGASPEGDCDLHRSHYPDSTLLFLGEERKGLTTSQRQLCDRLVRIPMVGEADSLNLAVAGSLMLYEVLRARSQVS
ncbi:MAG: RNA methyltransferase [Spirulina sp. SIO3F2]|nr:RNA methyltransferase [Spirulina sp. SIO3F2]